MTGRRPTDSLVARAVARLVAALAVAFALTTGASAHPPQAAIAQVKIARDGRIEIVLQHDALAFALVETPTRVSDDAMLALLDGADAEIDEAFADARERLLDQLKVRADGRDVALAIDEAPSRAALDDWKRRTPGRRLPVILRFTLHGQLPPAPAQLELEFPVLLDQVVVSFEPPGEEALVVPMDVGKPSPPFALHLDGGEPPEPPLSELEVASRYARWGFEHIIPEGIDHCLFVLGLFLLAPRVKTALWQITAFTVAHTITLTLTSLHIIGLPSSVVEPTIAASIAFIGIENLCTTTVRPWRIGVAFVFGLVHGMGVATAFNEKGFAAGHLVSSLAAFTVGVEAGHLAVLGAAFLALAWCRDRPWFRRRVTVPCSVIIAAVGLFWMVQRIV
ncbi:MAG: HupE/UreJ family protein [Phycisphaerales bacterium]